MTNDLSLASPSSLAPPQRSGPLVERDLITAQIKKLSQEFTRDDPNFRKALVDLLRQTLAQGHQEARSRLEAQGRGLDCTSWLSELEDDLIRIIRV